MNNQQFDTYVESVAQEIIEQLQKGTAPWQQPWDSVGFEPINATTEKAYNGMNALRLMCVQAAKGYKDRRWLTFNQAKAMGGHVRKGEKGIACVYWKEVFLDTNDEDPDGALSELLRPSHMIPCRFTVFNVEQFDGLALPEERKPEHKWSPIESAERILKNSGAVIKEVNQDQAFYSPSSDTITLPKREQFPTASQFYDTALHELGHWTGHASRLNRNLSGAFGSPEYAKEELRAEISSMMVSMSIGLAHNTEKHAAYVGSWIKCLQEDPKEIFRAATDADKIKSFVLKFEKEYFYVLNFQNNTIDYTDKETVITLVQKSIKHSSLRNKFDQLVAEESEKIGDPEQALFSVSVRFLDPRDKDNENLILNEHKGFVISNDPRECLLLSQKGSKELFSNTSYLINKYESEETIKTILSEKVQKNEVAEKNWQRLEATSAPSKNPDSSSLYYVYDFKSKTFQNVSYEGLEQVITPLISEYPYIKERLNTLTQRCQNNPYQKRNAQEARAVAIRLMFNPSTGPLAHDILGRLQHPGLIISNDPKIFLSEVALGDMHPLQKGSQYLKDQVKNCDIETISSEVALWRNDVNQSPADYYAKFVHANHYWQRLEQNLSPNSIEYFVIDYQAQTISKMKHSQIQSVVETLLQSSSTLKTNYTDFRNLVSKHDVKSQTINNEFIVMRNLVDPRHANSVQTLTSLNHPGIGIFRDASECVFGARIHSDSLAEQAASFCTSTKEESIELLNSVQHLEQTSLIAQREWKQARRFWREIGASEQTIPPVPTIEQPLYLVNYETNSFSKVPQKQAIDEAKQLLCQLTAPNNQQENLINKVFDSKSSTQICAINALLNPGSKHNLCTELNNNGLVICQTFGDVARIHNLGSESIQKQILTYAQQHNIDVIDSKNNLSSTINSIRARSTWFKVKQLRRSLRKQKDAELLERFPLVDLATQQSIQRDVHQQLLALAQPLLQKKNLVNDIHSLKNINQGITNELSR